MTEIVKSEEHIAPVSNSVAARFREATEAAGACKAMVMKKAIKIGARRYVPVECWYAIAVAHGCCPTIISVDELPSGVRAVAEIRRPGIQEALSRAEGFVGRDELLWYGGTETYYENRQEKTRTYPRREEFAIRAMAQTRAISRACRIFSHVIVLIDENLETTPVEEITMRMAAAQVVDDESGGSGTAGAEFEQLRRERAAADVAAKAAAATGAPADQEGKKAEAPGATADDEKPAPWVSEREKFRSGKWAEVKIHFGQKKGVRLGDLGANINWWCKNWTPKLFKGAYNPEDILFRAALDVAAEEGLK